jgi:uncharacterized SAM-binding protein YcdF (DUF218 family)
MSRTSKASRQREQLVQALLQQPSVEKAASSIGISSVTAWRIRKTAEFQEEYRQARRLAFAESIARLQHASSAAVSTLLKLMLDQQASASSRTRAADSVLRHAADGGEWEELEGRIQRLEKLSQTKGKGPR